MIQRTMEQGSPAWLQARLGIPTASGFDKILTPKTLKPSGSALPYRNQLLAEWLLGYPIEFGWGGNPWTDRGRDMEAEARAFYAFQHDVEVLPGGFVLRDDEKVGGSPDGLVGVDGLLEIKCPAIHTHIGYLLEPDTLVDQYRGQTQGYLYLTGRLWCDILSYNPELPAVQFRIVRDPKYHAALEAALGAFVANLDACKAVLAPHRRPAATQEAA